MNLQTGNSLSFSFGKLSEEERLAWLEFGGLFQLKESRFEIEGLGVGFASVVGKIGTEGTEKREEEIEGEEGEKEKKIGKERGNV